jgi:nuclear-control-of-ATPase protein 2
VLNRTGLWSSEYLRQSLERMTLSLCSEKLGYNQTQLDGLRDKIRAGDLTPVLQVYEQDIKSPVKNALMGSLVRTLLIQIQKTKVRGF